VHNVVVLVSSSIHSQVTPPARPKALFVYWFRASYKSTAVLQGCVRHKQLIY